MKDTQVTITEQIEVAKNLIGQRRLDFDDALTMLNALPADIGDTARSSVEQALHALAVAAERDSRYEALARFALARVIITLEQHLTENLMSKSRTGLFDVHQTVPFDATPHQP